MSYSEKDPARTCDLSFTDTLPMAAVEAMETCQSVGRSPSPRRPEPAAAQMPEIDAGMDVVMCEQSSR